MKNLIILSCLLFPFFTEAQNIGVNTSGNPAHSSAILDVSASDKGVLIPRISIPNLNNAAPVALPETSLLVYNTNTTTGVGYYYWSGTSWVKLLSSSNASNSDAWLIAGNAGTNAASNFIGTTDNNPLVVRTNNTERVRVLGNGRVGIATTNPQGFAHILHSSSSIPTLRVEHNSNSANDVALDIHSQGQVRASFTPSGLGRFAFGTAALPAVSFHNNNNTGMFRPALNNLAFSTNGVERMKIWQDGRTMVNLNAPIAFDMFSSAIDGTASAITGYHIGTGEAILGLNLGGGTGVWGEATAAGGDGVVALAESSTGFFALNAQNFAPNSISVLGASNPSNPALLPFIPMDGAGGTFGASIYGVLGRSTAPSSSNGVGVFGSAGGGTTLSTLIGGSGMVALGENGASGVFARALGTTGSALVGINNSATNSSASIRNENAGGTGLAVGGNGQIPFTLGGGSGMTARGTNYGVVGQSSSFAASTLRAGGFFYTGDGLNATPSNGARALVGARTAANVNRKIEGTGTVNTIIKDLDENDVLMSAPEAPENLFQDYGVAQLKNGVAYVELDPIFSKNIVVSEKHPLRVFIQLNGDCNGVYVTNESQYGFEVKELKNGNANVRFTYTVVANRADEINEDGTISAYSKERFAPASQLPEFIKAEIPQTIEKQQMQFNETDGENNLFNHKLKNRKRDHEKIINAIEKSIIERE
ncbi:MAG: hypothetical protein JJT77_01010 [Crocinitomicaceae bacterium]|nr:hypothetical protein [Crocinitomicaceae bacterium]